MTTDRAEGTGRRWRRRDVLATSTAVVLRGGPVVIGALAGLLVAVVLPAPQEPAAVALWWTAVLVTPLVVVVAVERAVRRWAPLPFLLRLSLTFPDEAPRRLKVLRETHRTSHLLDQLRATDLDDVHAPPTAASTLALVTALQRHDRFTRGHSERVRVFTDLIGAEMGLASEDHERLRWAALLHDIGKLRVDRAILNKDGHPDAGEWAELRRHPMLGLRLAGPLVPWLGDWAGAISAHHERFDGAGYPSGTAGSDIPLGGRIVAVADAYETMTAGRPYKRAQNGQQARSELARCAGSQFDPQVVRAFLALSLPRAPWPLALIAWIAQVPLLARLRAAPQSAVQAAAATAVVAAMAATGLVAPSPSTAPDAPDVAAPDAGQRDEGPAGRETEAPQTTGPNATSTEPTDQPPPSPRQDRGQDADSDAAGPEPDPTGQHDTRDRQEPSGRDAPRQIGHDDRALTSTLYLRSAGSPSRRYDVLPLSGDPATRREVGNYDTDVDDRPGLRLRPSGNGRDETALDRRQRWAVTRGSVELLAGPMQLRIWVRPAADGLHAIQMRAFVDDCSPSLDDCEPVTQGDSTQAVAATGWHRTTIDLDPVGDLDLDDRVLVLTLTAGRTSSSDVLVAFDTTDQPSALDLTRASLGVVGTTAAAVGDSDRHRPPDGEPPAPRRLTGPRSEQRATGDGSAVPGSDTSASDGPIELLTEDVGVTSVTCGPLDQCR